MGKGKGKRGARPAAREMPVAEDDSQAYARVTKMLGNNRVRARLEAGPECTCKIRGSMRRREWVNVGDLVLVALRSELAGDTADIVHKYSPPEAQCLLRMGVRIRGGDEEAAQDEDLIEFVDDDAIGSPSSGGGSVDLEGI